MAEMALLLIGIVQRTVKRAALPDPYLSGLHGSFQKLGYLIRGPHNKDYSHFGVYIRVPLFSETTTLGFKGLGSRLFKGSYVGF